MQHNYLMDNLNALFCISLQQTTFVYVLKQRSNTQCKTEKSHTAVSHRTNRSHTGDNARKYSIFLRASSNEKSTDVRLLSFHRPLNDHL